MTTPSPAEQSVRQAIDELIEAGTAFDINALERIYHDDLEVVTVDDSGEVSTADKAMFTSLFEAKRAAGADPLNTWADFHRVSVDGNNAHVLITRKVNLVDAEQRLTLSIDLINQDDRWQVVREVIFARPDTD